MAAPSNPGRLALAGVDLLADIPLDAAGDLLVSLLCDDARPELADAAVHALVRRNWPTVRRAVLACAATASSETFKRICHIASFSRHADFAPWLLASLQASAEPTHELVEASALVGGRELEAALLEQLRGTPWRLADFPPSTLEGVLSISSEWQAWVMANAADDLTHRALAVRHHLIDEAKTLEWLATAQGSDLEELIVAAGEGASVPRAVEDALLACLSGSAAVRSQVVYALLRIDNERHGRDAPPRHRELFAQLLDDPESEVRELALAALGNLGDARRLDRMLELAGDPKQPLIVRCASIEALGKLPSDPEITDHLEVWLADPSEQIGQAAALTLARTGPGRLAAHLASGRVRAALAQVGAEQGLLFFESFYVDAGGKRHPWKAESRPAINPARHSGPYFVSYNSRDIGIVRELVLQLEAAGFDVLWDQADLPRVGLWQQELYDLIQRAAGAIILCGPHGPGDWQKEEMFACVNRAKKATDFSLRSVFLPGMTIKPFASFLLDNYDQLDLRDGLRVEKLVQRLAGPRPQIQRSIPSSKLHAQYAPWPDAEENKPAIPAFGSLQAPPKAWQEMDGLARQRAHLQSHLDDPKTCARWSLDALDAGSREALELIHSAALLRRADYLAALWHRPWSPLVADLVKRGLLHEQDHFLKIEEHVAACLEKDEKTLLARQQQWIERLRPLSEHWDIALELCLQFVNTGAYPELIELAHHHVFAVEEAWVRKLFGQTLDSLAAKKSIWNRLPTRERLLLLDAQGVCKLKEGNAEAAHELFVRMARIASRTKDAWGLAEAWLHQGLTWYARQDDDRAAQCYRRSAEHAGEADDDLLRGRALHNLAQCLIERDPEQAAAVLEESVVCKQRAGDSLFATHHAHGLLAVQGGHLAEALRCFRRAERLARKSGNRDELAKVLHNQGNVLAALGRHDEAWKTGEEAYALAQKLQAPETLILTTRGLAVRCHQAGDGERASGLFQELAQLLNDSEDIAGSVVALSDAGASQFQRNDPQAARHLFDQAIELARSSGKVDGLVRVFRNYSVTFGGTTEAGLAWLEQTGEEATRRGEWCVLAELAAIEAGWRDREGAAPATIRACWDRAAAAAVHCRDWPHHLHILQQRYTWLRDHLGHKSAQAALEDLAKRLARRRGCESDYVAALSEWGNALQECGDHDQARRRYRQALRILQCHEDRELQTDLLNNLGESLRKTGEIDEAIACYQQALELTAGDAWEERLRIEHNLALAESESDSPDAGEKRLTRIRDLAKKRRLWTAQANACLALAHLSWEKPSQALRRYVSAIEVATRHDLTDIRLNAELNRARLLLTQDRAAEAASILGPLETHFAGHEFGLELHLELAEAHRQCGQASAALATLRNASNCLVEQPDRLADWHTALAQTLFMNGQAEDAWSTMNQALTLDCTTNRRADLLVDAAHLAVSLYRDCGDAPSSHVQTVIDLAHAETSWMPDQRRHFWNSLGEAFWQAGIHDDGAMCFLKAMIEDGTGEDLAAYGADGILLFHRLRELGEPRTQLLQQTKEWLMSQGITNDATLEQLLWPFSMADEVGTASLEQAALERMLVSVWQRIFPSTK